MKRIIRNIRGSYLLSALSKSMIAGVLAVWIMLGFIVFFRSYSNLGKAMIAAGVFFAVVLVVSLIAAFMRGGKIKKRLVSLQGTACDLSEEQFVPAADQLSVGKDWLVYHNGLRYSFWTRNSLADMTVSDGKKTEIDLVSKDGVEERVVVKNADVSTLQSWL